MKRALAENVRAIEISRQIEGVRVGRIAGVDGSGQVFVDFTGNTQGPVAARLTRSIDIESLRRATANDAGVLLVFENNNSELPIIVDMVSCIGGELADLDAVTLETETPKDIIVDGRRLIFEAQKEIVMRCGKGEIIVRADGKVIIKGTNLVSYASGRNKIKGGTVAIN